MNRYVLAVMATIAMCAVAPPARAADDCPAPTVVVTGASKVGAKQLPADATDQQKQEAMVVELGDTIEVTMTGLPQLTADADCRKSKSLPKRTLVLFLAAQSIKGATGYLPSPPDKGKMRFDLKHSAASKAAWALVLARPWEGTASIPVSVGYEDSYPFNSSATIQVRKLATLFAVLGTIFMVALIVVFFLLLCFTDMCRDGKPAIPSGIVVPGTPTPYGPFSLSTVQAGIWFLVVLGTYILIVAVTHDISGTVNTTALTLMGIGAATMIGSSALQTNQDTAADAETQAKVAKQLAERIQELKKDLETKGDTPEGEPLKKSLNDMVLAFKRATHQSVGFWSDILSDANGVNFHRFQMAAWTIVLAFIFIVAVTRVLAMPDFDNTLLALQGLSAGTYLGLKITEPKVTSVPEKPKAAETPPKPGETPPKPAETPPKVQ